MFDMQIDFAIPPISHFRRWLGEFFSLFQSYEISITLSINSLGKNFLGISRQSLLNFKKIVIYYEPCILPSSSGCQQVISTFFLLQLLHL